MRNEERINGLETQVRTLKRIVYGFGCLLVVGVVVGATSLQSVPDVIQAKKFEVVNDEGKTVVGLSANAIGMGRLIVRNKDSKPVAAIFSDTDGMGRLSVRSKDGEAGVLISVSTDGGEIITANDKGETTSTLPNPITSD
jgi:hypothetical protein